VLGANRLDGVSPKRQAERWVVGIERLEDRRGGFRRITRLAAVFAFNVARVAPTVGAYSSITAAAARLRPRSSVRNDPGSTISTRMPNGATSAATASESPSSANLAAQ
jgi:hypothetical protein